MLLCVGLASGPLLLDFAAGMVRCAMDDTGLDGVLDETVRDVDGHEGVCFRQLRPPTIGYAQASHARYSFLL